LAVPPNGSKIIVGAFARPFRADQSGRVISALYRGYLGIIKEVPMFDSLADRMKQDDRSGTRTSEVVLRWCAVAVISFLVFGGLYFAVHMME
jgi:hypothetical protein